jgi:hypothetical protein
VLRFRVKIGEKHHVSVHVYDSIRDLHRAIKRLHGEKAHPRDCAVTISSGDHPGGRLCSVLLAWRYCQPYIIAHEASHAAWECALAVGPGVGPSDDAHEWIALAVENIFKEIYRRVQNA